MKKCLLAVVFMAGCFQAEAALNVRSLSCEQIPEPLGVETTQPRFSWKLEADENGQEQTAYQILVADSPGQLSQDKGTLWDSGWVKQRGKLLIPYAGRPLVSLQNAWWKVRVQDQQGKPSAWSAAARFATGLLPGDAPSGKWIENSKAHFKTNTSWFRKKIVCATPPQRALVLVASRGYHELYVNGKKAGDRVFAPNASIMEKRTLYVVYDIAPLLKVGENMLGVWLSPGRLSTSRVDPAFLLEAKVDGQTVVSDASWKTKVSNLIRYYLDVARPRYGGEKWVETDALPNWNEVSLDDAAWANASVRKESTLLSADLTPPMRWLGDIQAKTVKQMVDGTVLVDFGEYFTGQIEAMVTGTPGQPVTFRPFSDLKERMDFRLVSEYVPGRSGKGVFTQRFNWVCGRWLEIAGLTETPKLSDIKIHRLGTDLQRLGFFKCSDDLLNQIYETDLHTFKSCTLDGYTMDCTHRERRGYGEEAFSTSRGCGLNNYDVTAFLRGWLRNWRDAQKQDGFIPHTAPETVGGGGTIWSSFTVLGPWDLWLASGDPNVLRENYPSAERWLNYLNSHVANGILQRYEARVKFDFLGDWARPVPPAQLGGKEKAVHEFGDSPRSLIFNNGIYALDLMTLAQTARALGKTTDEQRWQNRLAALRTANHKQFFNPATGDYPQPNQVLSALALLTGITPPADSAKAHGALAAEMKATPYLDAGSSGLPVFLQFLVDNPRYHDWFYRVLSRREYPGYGCFLAQGFNTWPELWDATCSSKTHTCFTGISFWFTHALAGVSPSAAGPGYEKFIVNPSFVKGIDHVAYEFDSPQGWIKVQWQRAGGKITLDLQVPPGATAEVHLPTGIVEKTGGKHSFDFGVEN